MFRGGGEGSFKENENTHFVFKPFSLKIVPFMRYRGKNMVEPDRTQMTIKYDPCALHPG